MAKQKRNVKVAKVQAVNKKTGRLKKGFKYLKGGKVVKIEKSSSYCSRAGSELSRNSTSRAGKALASKKCK
tara:strand:+ start:363 stop:575 length:213 start_codon:yes stop_codon:yes gene_type:complete